MPWRSISRTSRWEAVRGGSRRARRAGNRRVRRAGNRPGPAARARGRDRGDDATRRGRGRGRASRRVRRRGCRRRRERRRPPRGRRRRRRRRRCGRSACGAKNSWRATDYLSLGTRAVVRGPMVTHRTTRPWDRQAIALVIGCELWLLFSPPADCAATVPRRGCSRSPSPRSGSRCARRALG